MFSDESTIGVLADRVQSVRRQAGEKFKSECLKKAVKFPQTFMGWGVISVPGRSRFQIAEGTMDQFKYKYWKDVCYLKQKKWFADRLWIFLRGLNLV